MRQSNICMCVKNAPIAPQKGWNRSQYQHNGTITFQSPSQGMPRCICQYIYIRVYVYVWVCAAESRWGLIAKYSSALKQSGEQRVNSAQMLRQPTVSNDMSTTTSQLLLLLLFICDFFLLVCAIGRVLLPPACSIIDIFAFDWTITTKRHQIFANYNNNTIIYIRNYKNCAI